MNFQLQQWYKCLFLMETIVSTCTDGMTRQAHGRTQFCSDIKRFELPKTKSFKLLLILTEMQETAVKLLKNCLNMAIHFDLGLPVALFLNTYTIFLLYRIKYLILLIIKYYSWCWAMPNTVYISRISTGIQLTVNKIGSVESRPIRYLTKIICNNINYHQHSI